MIASGKRLIILLMTCILLLESSCKKSSPVESDPGTPGRRDYTWSVDTLDMPMNTIHSIWGAAPDDIWACGPAGDDSKWFQHYDGKKWTPYNISYSGNTLFGFSQNDVWMGCGDGQIWHYDGVSWKRNYTYKADNVNNLVEVQNIWGERPDDIYACGVVFYKNMVYEPESHKGFILHYDGQRWSEVLKGEFNSQFLTIRKYNNDVFVLSYAYDLKRSHDDLIVYYKLKGKKLEKIYSGLHGVITLGDFELLGGGLYFWMDKDIFIYNEGMERRNGGFLKLLSINEPRYDHYVFGRNMKDLFISTIGGLAHFDGSDVQYVLHYPDTQRTAGEVMFFEKEIVFAYVDYSTNTNMVVHGKLK